MLTQHADVAMCAVVGVPDEKGGEAVTAIVVAREGTGRMPSELLRWSRKKVQRMRRSDQFIKQLPMTGVGKVDKKVLKAGFWSGANGWGSGQAQAHRLRNRKGKKRRETGF